MTNEEFKEKTGFDFDDIIEMLKSDSVYTILRYGFKNPSNSGVDECDDCKNVVLYGVSNLLRN